MAKAKPDAPEEAVAAYDALLAEFDIPRKGAKSAYTSLNGNMFSYLEKPGSLALRLGEAEREAFVEQFNSQLAVSYDTVMKEYVVVSAAMLADIAAVRPHFENSLAYVRSLKPKPTKKKPVK